MNRNRNDILWKGILEDVFDDFLRFFFPRADDFFDIGKGFEYMDKELSQLFPLGDREGGQRYVDKLVKVYRKQGEEEWILVHIEVQGYNDRLFSRRMFQYYSRIFDRYEKSVTAIAIFTDPYRAYEPGRYEYSLLGTRLVYSFNTFKILSQDEAVLSASDNPFAMVVLIAKTALQGSGLNDTELLGLKLNLVKLLISKKIHKSKIRNLMNFLRYYIHFENPEMIGNFEKEVAMITKNSTTMGIEELLLDRARKEGIKKGKIDIARRLLQMKFSPGEISAITGVPEETIRKWMKKDNTGEA